MTRSFLCTFYEGPETWDTPRGEWVDPATESHAHIFDEEDAAQEYCDADWHGSACEGDPTKGEREVAVEEPATGQRWIVTVTAEAVVQWYGTSEEVER